MDQPRLEPEQTVGGRYRVEERIGAGGMAEVYRATDMVIEREVALKVLRLRPAIARGDDRETLLERFRREASAMARLRHRNVVPIHDYGVDEDLDEPFMVMDLLIGHTVETELEQAGAMAPARAISLVLDCLDALAEAHDQGVVHKDIKPSNLFLEHAASDREHLRVLDFGVAHIFDEPGGRLTQAGLLYSTPGYFAPEYVTSSDVGRPFDVYQVGLILVELLAGRPVVEDSTSYGCAMVHATGAITLPESLLDGPLGGFLCRSLALSQDDRYQDAGEQWRALQTIDRAAIEPISDGVRWVSLMTRTSSQDPAANDGPNETPDTVGTRPLESDRAQQLAEMSSLRAESDTLELPPSDSSPPSQLPLDQQEQDAIEGPPLVTVRLDGEGDDLLCRPDFGRVGTQPASHPISGIRPAQSSSNQAALEDGGAGLGKEPQPAAHPPRLRLDGSVKIAVVALVMVYLLAVCTGGVWFLCTGEEPSGKQQDQLGPLQDD